MYTYLLKLENTSEIYQLPLPPSSMDTYTKSKNQKHTSLSLGEISTINGVSLRRVSMDILLPNDLSLPFIQPPLHSYIIGKPIIYLSLFRKVMESKLPLFLIITRILPSGEHLFEGNMKVSIEDYTVTESADNNGDFLVRLNFLEYKDIKVKRITPIDSLGNFSVVHNRQSKDTPKTYTVKSGDTLWSIAKRQFNDGSKYKEIAKLNNIHNPSLIKVGQVLVLR